MRTVMTLGVAVGLLAFGAGALASTTSPVRVVKQQAAESLERVVYLDGDLAVVRDAEATDEDFRDVYVVNASSSYTMPLEIAHVGQVLAFEPKRFAVMRLTLEEAETVSGRLHEAGLACGVLIRLSGRPIVTEAVATPVPLIPVTTRDARVDRLVAKVQAASIRATVEELAAIPTRYHGSATGRDVPDLLAAKYEALRGGRADVTISKFEHDGTQQDSLVVRIEGATFPEEVIVLGSHLDSINGSTGRAPGADDNASGTATNLEIFRVMMEEGIKPERTLEIHAYAAEEIGLVGSQEIANDYRDRDVNVVAMVQHDMNIWKASGTPDKVWFVTNSTSTGFNDLLLPLATAYSGLATGRASLSGGSSDHASWTRAGFAAAFPFENPQGYNRSIHSSNDTVATAAAFDQAAGFAKLGLAYVVHFGGAN